MVPGQTYELVIDGVKNEAGDTIAAFTHSTVPQDTTSPTTGERAEAGLGDSGRALGLLRRGRPRGIGREKAVSRIDRPGDFRLVGSARGTA